MVVRIQATGSRSSFITRGVIPSGPGALWALRFFNSRLTPSLVIWMSLMTGYSIGIESKLCVSISSRVKTDWNWSFRMLALSLAHENVLPSFFKDATPTLSVLWCLMKDQKLFIPENSFGFSSDGRIMDSTCCQCAFLYSFPRRACVGRTWFPALDFFRLMFVRSLCLISLLMAGVIQCKLFLVLQVLWGICFLRPTCMAFLNMSQRSFTGKVSLERCILSHVA